VQEQPDRPGKPGRPEIGLSITADRYAVIAVCAVGRSLVGALVNLAEKSIYQASIHLPANSDRNSISCAIKKLISDLQAHAPVNAEILGAAFSLVGTINSVAKKWVSSARWPGVRNFDFGLLEKELGLPFIVSRSLDTELAYTLANSEELRAGGTILFHWGFGIGSAYAWNGHILDSSLGRFGEIGHTRLLTGSNRKCLCGARGCLETEASLWALLPALRRIVPQTPEDENEFAPFFYQSALPKTKAVGNAARVVTDGLLNLYKILYPDRILMIGPFVESKFLFNSIARDFHRGLPQYAKGRIKLVAAQGGFGGCLLGSAFPFFENRLRKDLVSKS